MISHQTRAFVFCFFTLESYVVLQLDYFVSLIESFRFKFDESLHHSILTFSSCFWRSSQWTFSQLSPNTFFNSYFNLRITPICTSLLNINPMIAWYFRDYINIFRIWFNIWFHFFLSIQIKIKFTWLCLVYVSKEHSDYWFAWHLYQLI